MSKEYNGDGEVDLTDRNNSHTKQVELVGEGKRVLDIGCHEGIVARALARQGCRVTGIELDPRAAAVASEFCERVVVGDVERMDFLEEFGDETFDVGLLGDIVEHLKDPQRVLVQVRQLLAPGGCVVVSVPNIAHASIRLMLLEGRFDYEELGILDNTHLRHFTRESICDLLECCGYLTEVVDWVEAPVSSEHLHEVLDPLGLASLEQVVRAFSDWEASAFQFIIKAFPAGEVDRLQRLSEEKMRAEVRLRELEKELAALRPYQKQWDALVDDRERLKATIDEMSAELRRAADYSKKLESVIQEKDTEMARLEKRLRELETGPAGIDR